MIIKKHNVKNIVLLSLIFFVVSFISVVYSALNTNMYIDGNAILRVDSDIRITDLKLSNSTSGGYEVYNSKYAKDSITNGILLPNNDSTITYVVKITNKGNQKYIINNIAIESSNNDNISFETNYSSDQVIEANSSKEIEITYKTKLGSENKSDIILKFSFAKVFTITFDANNGTVSPLNKTVIENSTYGDLPIPTKTGYIFLGWYTNKEFGEKIESTTKVTITNNQTLYAKWENKDINVYLYNGDYVFDGTNYIDTGIYLFSEENINKDFDISFEIKKRDTTTNLSTMISVMDESDSPWPGIVYRVKNGKEDQLGVNASSSVKTERNYQNSDINKVSIKRVNNIAYISFNDGFETKLLDLSSMLSNPFDVPATFGASLDGNLNPFRYFTGTLSNMSIKLSQTSKIIKYNSNNGSGKINQQIVVGSKTAKLIENTYIKEDYGFVGWNTKADGTGTSYSNKDTIDLSSIDDSITLYAQWSDITYTVKYDANGGIGTMEDQLFTNGVSQKLLDNNFTKSGTKFLIWNTKSDGSGTSYLDGQNVKNLSNTNGEIVTLYAMWGTSLEYLGNNVFDGTNYINTGLPLFSQKNIGKNFIISFEIKEKTYTEQFATILSAMNETGSPWPGIVYRQKDINNDHLIVNASSSVKTEKTYSNKNVNKITLKRINNIVYISLNDGANTKILDISPMLGNPFDVPLTFGASLDGSGNPFRYFTGTLSNIRIYVFD